MTVTNESLRCIHMKLFIHKNYLHGDMKGSAAPAIVSCSAGSVAFLKNAETAASQTLTSCPAKFRSSSSSVFASTLNHTHAHTGKHTLSTPVIRLSSPSLTCFQGGGALLGGDGPAAHRGAGAQVELVFGQRFQVAQGPLGDLGVADVYSLQRARLGVVD